MESFAVLSGEPIVYERILELAFLFTIAESFCWLLSPVLERCFT